MASAGTVSVGKLTSVGWVERAIAISSIEANDIVRVKWLGTILEQTNDR